MAAIAVLLLLLFAIPILSIIRGFALSYLWGWFIVPFGLPEIGVAWAIGISMIVAYLTYENPYQGTSEEVWGKLIGSIFSPFFVLLIGAIVHSFM